MMPRRLLGPLGRCLLFLLVAGLVIGGLGWVTFASLGVESAQRAAAAEAERTGKERLALWRLDGKLLPTLAAENFRKYEEYTVLYSPPELANTANFNTAALTNTIVQPPQFLSPLVTARVEPWMQLHVQLDPDLGWQSPQVMAPDLADRLRDDPNWLDLANVTDGRRQLLTELNRVLPAKAAAKTLSELDGGRTNESTTPVTITVAPPELRPFFGLDLLTRTESFKRFSDDFGRWMRDASSAGRPAAGEGTNRLTVPPAPSPMPPPLGEGGSKMGDNYAGKGMQPGMGNSTQLAQNPLNKQQGGFNDQAQRDMAVKGAVQAGETRGVQQAVLPPQPPTNPTPGPVGGSGGSGGPAGFAGGTPAPAGPGSGGPQPVPPPATTPPGAGPGGFGGGGMPRGGAGGGGGGGRGGFGGRPGGEAKKIEDKTDPGKKVDPPKDEKSTTGGVTDPKPGLKSAAAPAVRAVNPDENKQKAAEASAKDRVERGGKADSAAMKEQLDGKDGMRLKSPDNDAKKDATPTRRGPPAGVQLGSMRPVWLTDAEGQERLLFARVATLTNKTVYQAVVIDWPALRETLTAEVTDLFPAATLIPTTNGMPHVPERSMAALPAELDPGPAPELPPAGWTTLRIGLALAWVAALVALGAVWFGGWSLVDLSERRIRFVSAVTHELRTPLTSLRLYLDMLTSGMVKEEAKKQEYLGTLSTESDRLNRLIENVLDFSRLERRNAKVVREPVGVVDVLNRVRETWAERVAADGKQLVIMGTVPLDQRVTVDPRMVEQILGNLVDNARKYTRDAADPRIWVWAKPAGRWRVALEVEDRGPGVPAAERRTIFRPFRRGAEADTTAGGAGLGLALARQWAELCGGRLSYRPAEGGVGACFRLELPVG